MSLRLPEDEYKALCHKVLTRDCWQCQSCGFRGNLHVHHIWFRSQGGPDEPWNLVTLCNLCHDGVHTAIKDGVHGLTITVDAVHGTLTFVRAPWWKPQ